MEKKDVKVSKKPQEKIKDRIETTTNTNINIYEDSAIYVYNKETGKWEVRNPAGSIGYNYLYRDD